MANEPATATPAKPAEVAKSADTPKQSASAEATKPVANATETVTLNKAELLGALGEIYTGIGVLARHSAADIGGSITSEAVRSLDRGYKTLDRLVSK